MSWGLWGWLASAWAGVPVALPPGEDPGPWMIPLELAGLELARSKPAVLVVAVVGDQWELATRSGRTLRVAPPTTGAQREELAFLARGLVRDLDSAPTPLQHPDPPPPLAAPPPPPALAAAPRPRRPAPRVAEAPDPPPAFPPQSLRTRPLPPRSAAVPDVEPVLPARVEREPRVVAPPMWLSVGIDTRATTLPSAAVGLGTELARGRRVHLDFDLGLTPVHNLNYDIRRTFLAVNLEVSVSYALVGPLTVGALSGASYRTYNQQGNVLERGFVGVAGVRTDLPLWRSKRLGLIAGSRARIDTGITQFILDDQSVVNLVPFEVHASMTFRFFGSGDLFSPWPTSTE